jgi:hypothetical protein
MVLGYLMDVDIADLECLHAAIRRRLKSRPQTWLKQLYALSSDALLLRHRIWKHGRWWSESADAQAEGEGDRQQETPAGVEAPPPKKGPSGGPPRSFFHRGVEGQGDKMRTPADRSKFFSKLHAEYKEQRAANDAQHQGDVRMGRIATVSARAGQPAFSFPKPSPDAREHARRLVAGLGALALDGTQAVAIPTNEPTLAEAIRESLLELKNKQRELREKSDKQVAELRTISSKARQVWLPGLTGIGLYGEPRASDVGDFVLDHSVGGGKRSNLS